MPATLPRRRIALYSHDTMGIGHMRRNLLIAQVLADPPVGAEVLMVAGAREANAFPMPQGVDCLTLPALHKEIDGRYRARSWTMPLDELFGLRSGVIREALTAFAPDVLIVDKVPLGAGGELAAALKVLRARGRTRCVLGLRDVLDDPETVRREWRDTGTHEAIDAHFEEVWVYGDPTVYDAVREYDFPDGLAAKVRYTGYLDRSQVGRAEGGTAPHHPPDRLQITGPLALCMLGGGQDGAELAEVFSRAPLPPGVTGVLVTGPFLPHDVRQRLRRRATSNPRLHVLEFLTEPERLLARADCVVAMGGYNTVCEILAYGKRGLIVPRVRPRSEQRLRAERLRDLGLLDVLLPDELTPARLGEWLANAPACVRAAVPRVDLGGLARLPSLLSEPCDIPTPLVAPETHLDGVVQHVFH